MKPANIKDLSFAVFTLAGSIRPLKSFIAD